MLLLLWHCLSLVAGLFHCSCHQHATDIFMSLSVLRVRITHWYLKYIVAFLTGYDPETR